MNQDTRLNLIRGGNMADVAYSKFASAVIDEQDNLIKRTCQSFRSGNIGLTELLSFISSYCALEDVLLKLKKEITISNNLSKEAIYDDTKPS